MRKAGRQWGQLNVRYGYSKGGLSLFSKERQRGSTSIVIALYTLPQDSCYQPQINRFIAEGNLKITDDLSDLAHLQGLSILEIPWDRLVIYRTIIADWMGEKGKYILTEAESVHRRFLFSLGVAMALSLLTLQSLIRLILCISPLCNSLPSCPLGLLVLITLLGELTSFRLRVVAGRWWEEELILTVSLAHLSDLQKPEADRIVEKQTAATGLNR